MEIGVDAAYSVSHVKRCSGRIFKALDVKYRTCFAKKSSSCQPDFSGILLVKISIYWKQNQPAVRRTGFTLFGRF